MFAPAPDGRALVFYEDAAKTAGSISHLSAKDGARYTQFAESLQEMAECSARLPR